MALNSDIGLKDDERHNEDNLPDDSKELQGQPAILVIDGPDPLPSAPHLDTEDYDQLLQELRQTKTERAVTDRRNRRLNLDKVTFGITGAIAIAFVIWGFMGRDSLSETSTSVLNWVMEYT
ncbi:BCCT family transporter, partial [Arthrobacter sp. NPDC093128]